MDPKTNHSHRERADSLQRARTEDEPIRRLDTTGTTRTVATESTKKPWRSVGNPAPLGLGGFALTTFVLALVNLHHFPATNSIQVTGLDGVKGMVYRHVEHGDKESTNHQWTEKDRSFLWGLLDYSTISKGLTATAGPSIGLAAMLDDQNESL